MSTIALPKPVQSSNRGPVVHSEDDLGDRALERVFERSAELVSLASEPAARAALELLQDLVPSAWSVVARGALDDPALTIVAAAGQWAEAMVGAQVRYGRGPMGHAFDSGRTAVLEDTKGEALLPVAEARLPGGGLLVVPILADDGRPCGVLELASMPWSPFVEEQVRIVESIAAILARPLAAV